jgi:GDP-mannose 6-dehydrogenase
MNDLTVSMIGLGYVGAVTSACMSHDGFRVIGVDLDQKKIDIIARGERPFIEEGLGELVSESVESGRLTVTTDLNQAILNSDVTFVCVGTPSLKSGELDYTMLFQSCRDIAGALKAENKQSHTLVLRSTAFSGTTKKCHEIINEIAPNVDLHVAFHPEFLREGTAVKDHYHPPFLVFGTDDEVAETHLREIYKHAEAPIFVTDIEAAEMLKFVCNAWHATKITFANEVGRLAALAGVDGHEVMEMMCQDTKLNISSTYMRPGFAYGGSCLPKDLKAIAHYGSVRRMDLPMIYSIERSNHVLIDEAVLEIIDYKTRNIGLLGISFKEGTDDMRESPGLEVAQQLIGRGCNLRIYDPEVWDAWRSGRKQQYLEEEIPHVTNALVETEKELLNHANLIVITREGQRFRDILKKVSSDTCVMDLTGEMKI